MLEWLAALDRALFYFINVQLANPVTDLVMPFVTSDAVLRVLFAIAILLILWRGDKRTRLMVIFSGLTLALTDQAAANLLKDIFERVRPCRDLPDVHLLVNCGAAFSMPSAHAANAFGQALFWGNGRMKVFAWLLIVASLISVSRIFVGVHYPFDVLVGALVGAMIGMALNCIGNWAIGRYLDARTDSASPKN
ncbi:MAG: phosphatase PAP2 family protein [candidate division Zixibacteria bacterium]|nr:phosphatase PAP2 family protein [candidate division Zixibacteria bacterium]